MTVYVFKAAGESSTSDCLELAAVRHKRTTIARHFKSLMDDTC
jgi:hypothetical protein